MPLTDATVKNAKIQDKPYKLFDSGGLFVLVHSNGSKYWRFKYRFEGKEKLLALGKYPKVKLKEAREAHSKARELLEEGLDPSAAHRNQAQLTTFQAVAEQWLENYLKNKSESHYKRTESYLKRDVFPVIGSRPVADIKPPDIIPIIETIHKRVVRDTHLRTLQSIGQVLRYSIALGLRQDPDPTPSLKGLFPAKAPKQPFAAITDPLEVARLLRAIEHYSGNFITKCALQLSSMVMMRPGAFIRAEWKGIDLENALWTVEVKDMKAPMLIKNANRDIDAHLIPLPKQAVEIFKALYPFTGASLFVFQSPATRGGKDAPMSNETVTKALQRMGFQGQMTGHGFRSMASTLLNEMRRPDGGRMWDKDAIERQLSHKDKDAIRAAYNRADYLEERRLMLQCWADYLDGLREGGKVLPFKVSAISK